MIKNDCGVYMDAETKIIFKDKKIKIWAVVGCLNDKCGAVLNIRAPTSGMGEGLCDRDLKYKSIPQAIESLTPRIKKWLSADHKEYIEKVFPKKEQTDLLGLF